ncbi:MAG: HepT-like ribonuclease domain-containing protein [Thermoplasmata archaeon]
MNEAEARARALVDRMLREAAAAGRYSSRGKVVFFDIRMPEIRDAAELRILHFAETATRLGRPFRQANPLLPWAELERLRNDLVHDYPEVKAERVWRFLSDDLPSLVAKLRRARFPTESR